MPLVFNFFPACADIKKLEIVLVFVFVFVSVFVLPPFLPQPFSRAPNETVQAPACGPAGSAPLLQMEYLRVLSIAWTATHLLIGHLLRKHCC
jgi:hypothetical protein